MKHDRIITMGPDTLSEFLAHRGGYIHVSVPVLAEIIRQEKSPAPRPRRVFFDELYDEIPLSSFPQDDARRFGCDYVWYVAFFINCQVNGRVGDLSLKRKNVVFAEKFGIELGFRAHVRGWHIEDHPLDFVYPVNTKLIVPGH